MALVVCGRGGRSWERLFFFFQKRLLESIDGDFKQSFLKFRVSALCFLENSLGPAPAAPLAALSVLSVLSVLSTSRQLVSLGLLSRARLGRRSHSKREGKTEI